MPLEIVDTHCHLYDEQFQEDIKFVVSRAKDAGVKKILLPNIDAATLEPMRALCLQYSTLLKFMVGLHPTSVEDKYEADLDTIRQFLLENREEAVAIGEIGLDFYWSREHETQQYTAFKTQLQWAAEMGLPVAIHTRNSFTEAVEVVEEVNKQTPIAGVFHCFSGTEEEIARVDALGGFMYGIGGVLTFKNGGLDKVAPLLPKNKVVLETDSPYLAPVPHRGQRNEPAFTALVLSRLAQVWNMTEPEVAGITTANAQTLFPKAWR